MMFPVPLGSVVLIGKLTVFPQIPFIYTNSHSYSLTVLWFLLHYKYNGDVLISFMLQLITESYGLFQ